MNLRPERAGDRAAIRAILVAAFPTDAGARVVDRLWVSGNATLGMAAEAEGQLVEHILFSPVVVDGPQRRHGLGLAPLAVSPRQQKRGIGSLLIAAGRDACRGKTPFVVVLGEPGYYRRFRRRPARLPAAARVARTACRPRWPRDDGVSDGGVPLGPRRLTGQRGLLSAGTSGLALRACASTPSSIS